MLRKPQTRSARDRRQNDFDFPAGREKRRQVERRMPQAIEIAIDDAEWQLLFFRPSRKSGHELFAKKPWLANHPRHGKRKEHDRRCDRRRGNDRRQADLNSPVGRERRLSVEARMPEVVEMTFSPDEWDRYFCRTTGNISVVIIDGWLIDIERIEPW